MASAALKLAEERSSVHDPFPAPHGWRVVAALALNSSFNAFQCMNFSATQAARACVPIRAPFGCNSLQDCPPPLAMPLRRVARFSSLQRLERSARLTA